MLNTSNNVSHKMLIFNILYIFKIALFYQYEISLCSTCYNWVAFKIFWSNHPAKMQLNNVEHLLDQMT